MRQSARPRNKNWRFESCAAFVIAVVALNCVLLKAQAQYYQQLGPRTLYPRLNNHTNHVDVPLTMRDTLQYIALGTRLLAVRPRIMGGEPAPFGAWPWMASLELKIQRRRDAHFCGGAFIAPHWVITAAHCVKPDSAGAINVLGGTNTLETGGALYPVNRVIVHENYSTDTQDYDLALLHLSKAYPGKTIRPLTAADAERHAADGTYAISTGWGLTAEGGEVSNILRQVTVQIVSNKTCNGVAAYSGAVTDRMLCAGFPEGGKDSCQGDSGGPLMVPDGQGGYFLAGVTSWGEGCGRPNKFGVYTRVSAIQSWVAQQIGQRVAAPRVVTPPAATPRTATPLAIAPRVSVPLPPPRPRDIPPMLGRQPATRPTQQQSLHRSSQPSSRQSPQLLSRKPRMRTERRTLARQSRRSGDVPFTWEKRIERGALILELRRQLQTR